MQDVTLDDARRMLQAFRVEREDLRRQLATSRALEQSLRDQLSECRQQHINAMRRLERTISTFCEQ